LQAEAVEVLTKMVITHQEVMVVVVMGAPMVTLPHLLQVLQIQVVVEEQALRITAMALMAVRVS
jgi:hypothetical protein